MVKAAELDQVYFEEVSVQKQCNVDSVEGLFLKVSRERENQMWNKSWTFFYWEKSD